MTKRVKEVKKQNSQGQREGAIIMEPYKLLIQLSLSLLLISTPADLLLE